MIIEIMILIILGLYKLDDSINIYNVIISNNLVSY